MTEYRSYVLWNRMESYREGIIRIELPLRQVLLRTAIEGICVENTEEPIQNAKDRYADMHARYACMEEYLASAECIHRTYISS
jgi:hypothetical protein